METAVNISVALAELSTFLTWFNKTPVSRKNHKPTWDLESCWKTCWEAQTLVSFCGVLCHDYDANCISSTQNLLICLIHCLDRIEPISLNLWYTNIAFLFSTIMSACGTYSFPCCPLRWGFIHFNKPGLPFHSSASGNSFTMTFYLWKRVTSCRKNTWNISIMSKNVALKKPECLL